MHYLLCFLLALNLLFVSLSGLIFILTGACFVKLAFLHSAEQVARKQSILVTIMGVLITVLQPYFNMFEVSVASFHYNFTCEKKYF